MVKNVSGLWQELLVYCPKACAKFLKSEFYTGVMENRVEDIRNYLEDEDMQVVIDPMLDKESFVKTEIKAIRVAFNIMEDDCIIPHGPGTEPANKPQD